MDNSLIVWSQEGDKRKIQGKTEEKVNIDNKKATPIPAPRNFETEPVRQSDER